MSRVLKELNIAKGVEVSLANEVITVKGSKGSMVFPLNSSVNMVSGEGTVRFEPKNAEEKNVMALTGTAKAVVANMMKGVSEGFEKKMTLVGVGYRTSVQGNKITLNLGFSHPVEHVLPEGISAEAPSQTELVIRGIDKQKVGQVAADIRAYRPPEPYKGKGIRYADEQIVRKEAKKK